MVEYAFAMGVVGCIMLGAVELCRAFGVDVLSSFIEYIQLPYP